MATKQCFNNLNSDLDFVSVDGAFADIIRGEARGKAINRSELLPMVTNAANMARGALCRVFCAKQQ
jgi:hypothetical protein